MKVSSFKDFLFRGNIIDLAVGVIIGSAFSGLTNSLVKDIIMPPINLLLTRVSFNNWFIVLKNPHHGQVYRTLNEATQAGAITLNFGSFLTVLLNFIVIAFCVYLIIRAMVKIKDSLSTKADLEVKQTTKECPYCLSCVKLKAVKCPNCTSDLTETPTTSNSTSNTIKSESSTEISD